MPYSRPSRDQIDWLRSRAREADDLGLVELADRMRRMARGRGAPKSATSGEGLKQLADHVKARDAISSDKDVAAALAPMLNRAPQTLRNGLSKAKRVKFVPVNRSD